MILELFKKVAQEGQPGAVFPVTPSTQPTGSIVPQPPSMTPTQPAPMAPVQEEPKGPEPLDFNSMHEPFQELVKMVHALQEVVSDPYSHHGENPEMHRTEIETLVAEIKRCADELAAVAKKI